MKDHRDTEIDLLRRQLRQSRQRCHSMFDLGFEACRKMAEAGATTERLREASAVVVEQYDITEVSVRIPTVPTEFLSEQESTEVDILPLPEVPL